MKSVNFHELLHVVTVNFPQDDGLPDFLVIDNEDIDGMPNFIYSSVDGTKPLPVSRGEVTRYMGISIDKSIQVSKI